MLSAEAKLYGIIKTYSETLKDWNKSPTGAVMADASTALGIIGRTQLGKLRQIATSYLWLQQESIRKKFGSNIVKGTKNPADINTKGLSGDEVHKYVELLNMEHRSGRADLAPEVRNIVNNLKCCRTNSTAKHKKVRFT